MRGCIIRYFLHRGAHGKATVAPKGCAVASWPAASALVDARAWAGVATAVRSQTTGTHAAGPAGTVNWPGRNRPSQPGGSSA
jgi:hypothetical protein